MAFSLAIADRSKIIYHFIGDSEEACYAQLAKEMDEWRDDPETEPAATPADAKEYLEGTDFGYSMVELAK